MERGNLVYINNAVGYFNNIVITDNIMNLCNEDVVYKTFQFTSKKAAKSRANQLSSYYFKMSRYLPIYQ